MNEELDNVTQAQWASCVRHTEKLQEDDILKEIGRDTILEPIIINLQETDNEETDADEETDESDRGSVCDDNIDEDENVAEVCIMLFNACKITLHYLFVDMLHQELQMY